MRGRETALSATAIAVFTAAVFSRATQLGFVNFDDPIYVTQNPTMQQGLNAHTFAWAWTAFVGVQWYPLTLLSHLLDVTLFGLNPAGHHATSVALHALNAGLLYIALLAFTGRRGASAAVALLFAVHPLRVESVAWVSERKDVLSGTFWMLALLAYAGYARRPSVLRYLLVLLTFAGGLLSKPMVVTLPCVLLLLDWWPLGRVAGDGVRRARWTWLVVEKLPFFMLSVAASAMTVFTQARGGAVASASAAPIGERGLVALGAYWVYVQQLFAPIGLAVFYPVPHDATLYVRAGLGLALLMGVSVAAWRIRRRHPAVLVGWLWYAGVLVPVVGLVQAGAQAHADRYTYLAQIGLLIAGVWLAADTLGRIDTRVMTGVTAAACAAFATLTWIQLGYWRSSETLFAHALAATRNNARAHDYYGQALLDRDDAAGAIPHFEESMRLEAGNPQPRFNLAVALKQNGQLDAADILVRQIAELFPNHAGSLYWIGSELLNSGRPREAVELLERAAATAPARTDVRVNLGIAYGQLGDLGKAEMEFRAALDADARYAPAYTNLGVLRAGQGDRAEAQQLLEEALKADPDYLPAKSALAALHSSKN